MLVGAAANQQPRVEYCRGQRLYGGFLEIWKTRPKTHEIDIREEVVLDAGWVLGEEQDAQMLANQAQEKKTIRSEIDEQNERIHM